MTRALITGIGAVTPVGATAPESWRNLLAGVSGIAPIEAFDASDLPVRIAGEVQNFTPSGIDSKAARRMSRFAQFCVTAAQEAAADAGLELTDEERPRAAVALATGAGGVLNTFLETENYIAKGPARVSPFFVPLMAPNMGACQVSMHLGLRGPTLASTAACASGLYSYIEAKALIESGLADVVVAGGGEARYPSRLRGGVGEHEGPQPPQRRPRGRLTALRPGPRRLCLRRRGVCLRRRVGGAGAEARGARLRRDRGRCAQQRRLPHHGPAGRRQRRCSGDDVRHGCRGDGSRGHRLHLRPRDGDAP